MGDILGLGVTHYPPLVGRDENMAGILTILRDPGLPERYRDPANWPAPMRREYGDDGGAASAAVHRETLVRHFRHARAVLDEFRPDVVVIWGDDQYENFTEDIIPPFCILAYEQAEARHRKRDIETSNVWSEGADTAFRVAGHRDAGKYLASRLLEDVWSASPDVQTRTVRCITPGWRTRFSTRSCSSITIASVSPTRSSRSR